MYQFVSTLNAVSAEWRNMYDLFSCCPVEFSLDDKGQLLLNHGETGISAGGCRILSADCEPEEITFYLDNGKKLWLQILWPEDGAPSVSSVLLLDEEEPEK